MPTLPSGTEVSIRRDALRRLSFPPPEGAVLVVAVHEAINVPVKFVSTGEGVEDMDVFDAEKYSAALLSG